MDSERGALIRRVFRKKNRMAAGVTYRPHDFTFQEGRVLELIACEQEPSSPKDEDAG